MSFKTLIQIRIFLQAFAIYFFVAFCFMYLSAFGYSPTVETPPHAIIYVCWGLFCADIIGLIYTKYKIASHIKVWKYTKARQLGSTHEMEHFSDNCSH